MHRRRRLISTLLLFVFTAYMLALAGCGNDDVTGLEATPPDIPPTSTFLMDFDDFKEGETLRLGATRQNWAYAGLNVLVWNTVLTVALAVPAASFIAAVGRQPVMHPDSTWVWSYNFQVNEVLHLAELHGRVEGDEVVWGMYISKQDAYTDFLWYSGVSDLGGGEGEWTVYGNPDDPTAFVGISWHRDPGEGTADITYTNTIPGNDHNGDYISHGITGGTPYDANYDIYNTVLDNHTNIEWNRIGKEGRVMDPDHFGDSDWHCWDGLLEDVDCP